MLDIIENSRIALEKTEETRQILFR
jgi:hypothetical protein